MVETATDFLEEQEILIEENVEEPEDRELRFPVSVEWNAPCPKCSGRVMSVFQSEGSNFETYFCSECAFIISYVRRYDILPDPDKIPGIRKKRRNPAFRRDI